MKDSVIEFLKMHGVLNCHWLSSWPPSAFAYANLSGAGHTLKQNIGVALRLFLQLPLSLSKEERFY